MSLDRASLFISANEGNQGPLPPSPSLARSRCLCAVVWKRYITVSFAYRQILMKPNTNYRSLFKKFFHFKYFRMYDCHLNAYTILFTCTIWTICILHWCALQVVKWYCLFKTINSASESEKKRTQQEHNTEGIDIYHLNKTIYWPLKPFYVMSIQWFM